MQRVLGVRRGAVTEKRNPMVGDHIGTPTPLLPAEKLHTRSAQLGVKVMAGERFGPFTSVPQAVASPEMPRASARA